MFFMKLDTLEQVNALVNICTKYKDQTDVDVLYGRYILDGCSALGVTSLVGKIIKIRLNTEDKVLLTYFFRDLEEIGGYKIEG